MTIENKRPNCWEMTAFGLARGVIFFPVEHILDRMRLESQAHTEKTTKQAITSLWRSQGLKGLYAGSGVNFLRRATQETYYWPVMLSINRMWKHIIPEKYNKDHLATNIATGHSMALVQASVTLPFERLLIEKTTNKGYLPFLKKMRNSRRLMIYEGFQATLIRHSLLWDLFFLSSHGSAIAFKKIDPNYTHPYLNYLGTSVITSTFIVGIGYPFEFLRNRMLMEPEILSKGTFNGMRSLFHRYKWTKLYKGAPVAVLHNFVQALAIHTLINKINTGQ